MRRSVLASILFLICIFTFAGQKYTAFIVKGNITIVVNGHSRLMKKGDVLDETIFINVPQGAFLTLRSNDKRHTITMNKDFKGTIKQMKKIHGARVKRTVTFMDIIRGKTSDDFVNEMSVGGYNTRGIFCSEEEKKAFKELELLFEESGLLD